MALVDYSSDSEPEAEHKPEKEPCPTAKDRPPLPPLPPSFHDLYASTVRASARDDPSLHQGRSRQIPHIAGNWPSHIYIEWFPTQDECAKLSSLLEELRSELAGGADDPPGSGQLLLHSFLTSDLGTPLPLHISLSRPFVLTTREKDGFLRRLTAAIEGQTAISKFAVHPSALSWHRSPDSNRAFFVLRVREGDGGGGGGNGGSNNNSNENGNPGLAALLAKCNALVTQFGQPPLYASSSSSSDGDGDGGGAASTDDRFHVSVAWSFADVTEELRARTAAVYGRPGFQDQVGALRIPVECVKVKIGNVVSSLALSGGRPRRAGKQNIFGI